jgi:hypothetical protein
VLAVLMVSYASSLRAYLQQRQELMSLQHQIDSSTQSIARLEREKRRWNDPAFVRAETRARLGWVLPGEIAFRVIGENDKPLGQHDSLPDPGAVSDASRPIWWKTAWGSMEAAGNPQEKSDVPQPVMRIKAPKSPAQHR